MKTNCGKAKQLFVLTHNFTFFKLVRDWFSMKNKKDKPNVANFYSIKANNERPRVATYSDAEPALMSYNSEYHYIFSRLYSLKDNQELGIDDLFLSANLSRRLLESFLSFKFPKSRGNFGNLIEQAAKLSDNFDDDSKNRIRDFTNHYSHSDLIETNQNSIDNLMGEVPSVILDIFNWIKVLDKRHYKEMIDIANNPSHNSE